MEPELQQILKESSEEIINSISFKEIKPLLLEYKIFNRYMWEDIHSVSDVINLLPSRGPDAFQNFICILRKANYHEEANRLENTNSLIMNIPSELMYKMSSKALDIGYNVTVETDLKSNEMSHCLEKFSISDFKDADSAIVIIMSHGGHFDNEDGIYGIDGHCILKKHIVALFSNANCPQLQGKPKVFFFIACREDNKDYGVPIEFPSESLDVVSMPLKTNPPFTDILIVHSTLPYNISIRNHKEGTWFCQELISVLKNNHSIYDIETMMKLVNKKLTKRFSLINGTQASHTQNIAFKVLMLCRVQVPELPNS